MINIDINYTILYINLYQLIITPYSDDHFFSNLSLILQDETHHYNLSVIYQRIVKFYKEIIGVEFEDNFYKPKEKDPQLLPQNNSHLAELITGLSAQCDKRGYFLNIMQNMDPDDSTELFTILTERISAYADDTKISEFRRKGSVDISDEDEQTQTTLFLRIESLEIENAKLSDEIKRLSNVNADLTKENYTRELNIKEMEIKHHELLSSLEHRGSDIRSDFEEQVNVSIQLSELKGKLESKEINIQRLKDEKEKLVDDYKSKLLNLTKENELLREKSIKYDVLKEKMHSFDDISMLKTKIMNNERIIKEQDEKIKKLKNYDVDKSILLKKIEKLNFDLSQEKEKLADVLKENSHYKDLIIQNESETKFLRKQVESLKVSDGHTDSEGHRSSIGSASGSGNPMGSDSIPLSYIEIEEITSSKKTILELETKIKFLTQERDNQSKENAEQDEKTNAMKNKMEEYQKELEKYMKKESKYTKYKEEKHTFITKLSEVMDKLHEARSETEMVKFSKEKEINECEVNHKSNLNNQLQKHNEEIFNIKEQFNRLENENSYLKREIKKNEELNDSNKSYIEELQRKITNTNPNSDSRLTEFENKLNEFATNENKELKSKLGEKDDQILKLNEKNKAYENKVKAFTVEIEKIKKDSEKIPAADEMKKTVDYYKSQLETKEKLFREEQSLMSSVFHQLALEYTMLQDRMNNKEGPFNFNIS